MEEIYKEITLILDILKSIEEFNEWLNQRRERKQILSFGDEHEHFKKEIENKTIHEIMNIFQERINKIQLSDEEECCPLNGILITTNQCLNCNIETTQSTSPMFLTIKRNFLTQIDCVQKAIVSFLEAHYCSLKQCQICKKDLMVINEYLFEPQILCVELSNLNVSLNINKKITINGKKYECIGVVAKRNNSLFSCKKINNQWIYSSNEFNSVIETDDVQFTFFKKIPLYSE